MNIFLKLFPSKSSLLLLSFFLGMLSVACEKNPSTSSQVLEVSGTKLDGNGLPYGTVSLTFDDGPGPRTLELSRFLASHGIRATFFVQGRNVARYPGILWELHHNGHLIANHSYTQRRLSDSKDPAAEVRLTDELIRKYVRNKNFLFRAPADDWNSKIANILNSSGLTKYVGSVSWDIGGTRVTRSDGTLSAAADWDCWLHQDSVDKCLEGYMNETLELSKGIVLMHDVHSSTIDMVKLMIPRLKSEGFIFARADEVPSIKDALARRSDGEDVISVSLKEFSCPTGFSATSVGLKGAVMCLSEKEAQGPFSQGMQDECVKMGGGDACKNSRWSRSLAILLYGKDRCPGGGSFDANYGGCIEGNNVFGPFTHEQVARCLAASSEPNSPICMSNRWSRDFLAQLMFRL